LTLAEAPPNWGDATERIEVRGAVTELFRALRDAKHPLRSYTEVLVDGPAGTGKTYGIILLLDELAEKFPRIRIAIARAHKARLAESVMVSMRKALADVKPYLFRGSDRGRTAYRYRNGSVIVPTGLDDPERQKSVEADVWYINEVTEVAEQNYKMVLRSMRYGKSPWQVLLSDCNPTHKYHWVNQRCTDVGGVPNPDGKMHRLKSRIQDNPAYWNEYLGELTPEGEAYVGGKLSQLDGVLYRRLVLGEWCSEEGSGGQFQPNF